ncbi:MAG: YjbF family lipoprotein [Pseudomonadota bacterium]
MRHNWCFGVLGVAVAVSGCDVNRDGVDFGYLERFRPGLGGGRGATTVIVDPASVSGQAAAPVLAASLEGRGTSNVFALSATNGNVQSWVTNDNVAIFTEDGLVVGTAGLTYDLYTAQAPTPADWGPVPLPASGDRIHRRIGGDDKIIIDSFSCEYQDAGRVDLDTPTGVVSARVVIEACGNTERSFENAYFLDRSDQVLATRQWLGPGIGFVSMQFIGN